MTRLAPPSEPLQAEMNAVTARTAQARARVLGFPAASDIDYRSTGDLLAGLVNNLGDPEMPGRWPVHVKDLEHEVIATMLDWFGGHPDRCWGYVTAGSSEGVLHGLWQGRERFPDGARVYTSAAAHYCVAKNARLLGLPFTVVEVDGGGRMRPDRLAAAAGADRGRAALVVATAGTTMTEAVDDLAAVHAALDHAGTSRRHIVVDAALSGPALALEGGPIAALLAEPADAGADCVVCSGHKFFGTPLVCGVALTRREHLTSIEQAVELLASRDVTVTGSRSGLPVAQLWWVLHRFGRDGHRDRARRAREVAARAVDALRAIGWRAWRYEHACTVVIDPPPEALAERWALPTVDGLSHVVCVPGVSDARIARFVRDLAAATGRGAPPTPTADPQPAAPQAIPLPREGHHH